MFSVAGWARLRAWQDFKALPVSGGLSSFPSGPARTIPLPAGRRKFLFD
jgi:hypothetical protein